jgi:hypothetical protein
MAASGAKKSTRRTRKSPEPKRDGPGAGKSRTPADEASVEIVQPVGVIVSAVDDGQGNTQVNVEPVGVKVTEVDTILVLALKGWRAKHRLNFD